MAEENSVEYQNALVGLMNQGVTEDQAKAILGTWAAKDRASAYDTMAAVASKQGQGITTPGKYGVYVGNPMGAFASGFGSSYAAGSKLQDALKSSKAFEGLAGAFGKEADTPMSVNDTVQALRGNSMPSASTYPATPPASFNGTPDFNPCDKDPNSYECQQFMYNQSLRG